MSEHALASQVLQHLDPHLAFAMLGFLSAREGLFAPEDMLKAKIACLSRTNMVDFLGDLYPEGEKPTDLADRRAKVIARLGELRTAAAKCIALLAPENAEEVEALKAAGEFTLAGLQAKKEITKDDLAALHSYARFQYDCGNYDVAHEALATFVELTDDAELKQSALWGRLASAIMLQQWDAALSSIEALRDSIDESWKRQVPPLRQLQQRTWLIHWSLFVFFNHESGRNLIVDMLFNNDRYLNAIQNTSPHIMRYIATAIATNKRRRSAAYALVRVLQHEAHAHSDPITEFMVSLYVDFDFEVAQEKLAACKPVLENDFFLSALTDEFQENGRIIIFDTYCRIHQKIDISMLAQKLDMDQEAAERWIVDLIRNARFDAKIDAVNNTVVMGGSHTNTYQKIIEKTKGIQFRSFNVANNIAKLQRQNAQASAPAVAAVEAAAAAAVEVTEA